MCHQGFRWSPSRTASGGYNVTYCSLACRNADPIQHGRLLAMNAAQQAMKVSKLEVAGYALLDEMSVAYERQRLLFDKFCVDAFVPTASLVIQFDGDYWHGNPLVFPSPDARQQRRMALDRSQDAYLAKCGLRVTRIWESDMYRRREHVRETLLPLLVPLARKPVVPA